MIFLLFFHLAVSISRMFLFITIVNTWLCKWYNDMDVSKHWYALCNAQYYCVWLFSSSRYCCCCFIFRFFKHTHWKLHLIDAFCIYLLALRLSLKCSFHFLFIFSGYFSLASLNFCFCITIVVSSCLQQKYKIN